MYIPDPEAHEEFKRQAAERLREARYRENLTQQAAVDLLRGVLKPEDADYPSLRSYQRWEAGDELPRKEDLLHLADAMGFEVADLLVPQGRDPSEFVIVRRIDSLTDIVSTNAQATHELLTQVVDRLDVLIAHLNGKG